VVEQAVVNIAAAAKAAASAPSFNLSGIPGSLGVGLNDPLTCYDLRKAAWFKPIGYSREGFVTS
jgi:hypothetical protein